MSVTDPLLDEDYASDEDSDFAPDDAAGGANVDGYGDVSGISDSDDDNEPARAAAAASTKRKRAAGDDGSGAADEGFENSGDEAIISKGKRREKKSKKRKQGEDDAAVDEDDEGGDGGLIKTRSMRANEKAERRAAAVMGPVTVDVNDLWAQMMAGPIVPAHGADTAATCAADARQDDAAAGKTADASRSDDKDEGGGGGDEAQQQQKTDLPSLIKIKRTYNFAGKVHTEEKVVPRDSAEAKVYLASLGDKTAAEVLSQAITQEEADEQDEPTKRKPRRAFRSAFEPVSLDAAALLRRADLNLGMAARLQMREERQETARAKKLNVVEKSRMDWAGFVDKEGIKDELELAGRSKQSYASRQDFLARVEANREEDARRARMAGRV
jgi:hypothetical protein